MKRRSPIVTVGQTPGTAQLAATASTRSTPDLLSNTTSSPVSVSIPVTRRTREGQWCDGSRWAMTSRRTDSATVSVCAAIAPIRCSFCTAVVSGASMALMNSSVMDSTETPGWSSCAPPASEVCRSKSSSRRTPLPSWAATVEPAEVPSSTSLASSASPASDRWSQMPCNTPVSQAMPARPPPARTRARSKVVIGQPPGASRRSRKPCGRRRR